MEQVRLATINRFGSSQWTAMQSIVQSESGFNPYAMNRSSGACGLFQSLPCAKVLSIAGSLGNIAGQINWGLSYVQLRYGTPSNAWLFHQRNGWY